MREPKKEKGKEKQQLNPTIASHCPDNGKQQQSWDRAGIGGNGDGR